MEKFFRKFRSAAYAKRGFRKGFQAMSRARWYGLRQRRKY
jgi:hypothetical protein